MLALGMRSNVVMALMIGAMVMQGIVPGPSVVTSNRDLFWGLIASMWIGNAVLVVLNLPLIGLWVSLSRCPIRSSSRRSWRSPASGSTVSATASSLSTW